MRPPKPRTKPGAKGRSAAEEFFGKDPASRKPAVLTDPVKEERKRAVLERLFPKK